MLLALKASEKKELNLYGIITRDGRVVKCLPLNPGVVESSTTYGHHHDSSYGTSTGYFQESDSREIYLCCDKLFHN